jgi:hypothetical protein
MNDDDQTTKAGGRGKRASAAGTATGKATVRGVGAAKAAATGTSHTVRPEDVESAYLKMKGARGRAAQEQKRLAWQRHVAERYNALREKHPNVRPGRPVTS